MDNASRPTKAKPAEKKSTYVKFSEILRKYRVIILAVFGAALLAVIAVAVVTTILDAQTRISTGDIEKLDADYQAYSGEQDTTKKAELEKAILASIESVIKKWTKNYAAIRAQTYRAQIYEAKKDWPAAEKDWLAISTMAPNAYIAPVALQSAAVAAEEQGAQDRAAGYYRKLVDKYADSSAGTAHAYFALGRIAEQTKDYASALTSYEKVVASWPDSDWTKLATDRILFMKSHGLSK